MLDWRTIETVLLDMDGTLLDLHFDSYFWFEHLPMRYAQAHNVSEDKARFFLSEKIKEYEGTLQWYCLDHWSELVEMDLGALKAEIQHKIQTRPYAEEFLKKLKMLGKKLILATNAHPTGLEIKLNVTRIDRWLDIVISSHQFKSPKEDQSFWQQFHQQEQFDPSTTLFIDDSVSVLESAERFGIQHLVQITLPDSQQNDVNKTSTKSNSIIAIKHFDEIMP
ncbi:MAG: haloacid dehalogenase [Alteromonadaceae bacterium]|nr:MAG: haloacid dehalogenase [Alteromonadaceae bacterium]